MTKVSLLLCVTVDSTAEALLEEEPSSVGEVHKRLAERHGNRFSSAEYFLWAETIVSKIIRIWS